MELVVAEVDTLVVRAAAVAAVIERSSSLAAIRATGGGERATTRRPKEIRFLFAFFFFAGDALIACHSQRSIMNNPLPNKNPHTRT